VPVRTGRLRSSIRGSLSGLRYSGGANVPYAGFVEARRHNLQDAIDPVIAQMRGGQELAQRLASALRV
jgi:hypothetical protein